MKPVRCPICDVPMPGDWSEYPEYPFCSKRCRTIDLGRWLGEEYKLSSGGGPSDAHTVSDDEPDR
jgi:endogenous inhibitor of DNA gyrase (YacG/DUF329 family)